MGRVNDEAGLLAPYRVLDLSGVQGQACGKRLADLIDRRQVEVGDGEFGALPCQLVSNSGGDPASPTRNKD